MDPDTIELGWLNKDDIITDDNRVAITESMHDSVNNDITTVIQFDPMYEEDEGTYSCYSTVNELQTFASIQLQNFRSEQVTNTPVLLFLNQATTSLWPVHAWFLRIAFVYKYLYACHGVFVCVCPPPKLNNYCGGVM